MSIYAESTSVSVERSKAEIESLLSRYGASAFAHGWDQERAMVQFQMNGRSIRFLVPLPRRDEKRFTHTASRRQARRPEEAYAAWEQGCRQRWRALALVIKAKLEAVAAGISVFEEEFLAHIVLPNGKTAGEWMVPQIAEAYETHAMPPLLLGAGATGKGG